METKVNNRLNLNSASEIKPFEEQHQTLTARAQQRWLSQISTQY
jgi:hypothetical protein